MASQFEGSGVLARLSPELFEAVLQNLDLASLLQLRLVSHGISKRCLGPHFKALIEAIPVTTDLSAESLLHLDERASHPWLGCTVKNLTVTALVYHSWMLQAMSWADSRWGKVGGRQLTDEEKAAADVRAAKAKVDLEWMQARIEEYDNQDNWPTIAESLASILRKLGRLDSLKLDARYVRERDDSGGPLLELIKDIDHPMSVQPSVSRVLCIVTQAMVQSRVQVDSLVIYSGTECCNVDAVGAADQMERLGDAFDYVTRQIRSYSLSFFTWTPKYPGCYLGPTVAPVECDGLLGRDDEVEAMQPETPNGVAAMLMRMPRLTAIDLHQYYDFGNKLERLPGIFSMVAGVRLPLLERVVLRGLFANQKDLLGFLAKHPLIKSLDLRRLRLTSGSWDSVCAYISGEMPSLEHLRLSKLWGGLMLNLDPVDERFAASIDDGDKDRVLLLCDGSRFVHTREITMEEMRDGLRFKDRPRGLSLNTREYWDFAHTLKVEYHC